MDVFIVVVPDRHASPDPRPFSTAEKAVEYAYLQVPEGTVATALSEVAIRDGWPMLLEHGTEGDHVFAAKRVMDSGEQR